MYEHLKEHGIASPIDSVLVSRSAHEMPSQFPIAGENKSPSVEDYAGADTSTDPVRRESPLDAERVTAFPVPHNEVRAPIVERGDSEVLHVGCGVYAHGKLPPVFQDPGWKEIRLDIDPDVIPDYIASITDMRVISDARVDAVYSSHNIEHLYPHEVQLALREMCRVLKPPGFAFIKVPDLQEVARHVADGRLDDTLYLSPMGPIAALDILFGHRPSLEGGNAFMAHRTGFTDGTLGAALINAGFAAALVQRDPSAFCLEAVAFRTSPETEEVMTVQAQMLTAPDRPAVIYTRAR
jgi:SAM-dependent methyltransferase